MNLRNRISAALIALFALVGAATPALASPAAARNSSSTWNPEADWNMLLVDSQYTMFRFAPNGVPQDKCLTVDYSRTMLYLAACGTPNVNNSFASISSKYGEYAVAVRNSGTTPLVFTFPASGGSNIGLYRYAGLRSQGLSFNGGTAGCSSYHGTGSCGEQIAPNGTGTSTLNMAMPSTNPALGTYVEADYQSGS